jgi:hypothetical protein
MFARTTAWSLAIAVALVAFQSRPSTAADATNGAALKADAASLSSKDAAASRTNLNPGDAKPKKPKRPPLDEGIVRGEKPLYPRVVCITTKNDPKCDAAMAKLLRSGGDFESLRSAGWTIGETADNNIQIVDRDRIPKLASELKIREYPAVACINKVKVVRSFKSGCTTPLDMWTFAWLAKGVNERPADVVPEAAQVATTGHWPLRGNHWSVSGDWNPTREAVIEHLRGPNHAWELAADWKIEDWSYEELRSLHDDLHERYPSDNGSSSGNSDNETHSKGEVRH